VERGRRPGAPGDQLDVEADAVLVGAVHGVVLDAPAVAATVKTANRTPWTWMLSGIQEI
jgi:hypothetical protein